MLYGQHEDLEITSRARLHRYSSRTVGKAHRVRGRVVHSGRGPVPRPSGRHLHGGVPTLPTEEPPRHRDAYVERVRLALLDERSARRELLHGHHDLSYER